MILPDRKPVELPAGPSEQLRRLAERIGGRHGHPASPEALASHLSTVVRRAIQTGRGPMALARWVARADPSEPAAVAERAARTLAANLVQLLLEPPVISADTVRI